MFTWLNKQGVSSDRGFVVQSIDRFTIEYREGSRTISIDVEDGINQNGEGCVIIEPTAFQRWDDDPPTIVHPADIQERMLDNFREAMEFQGIKVSVERRFN